MTNIKKSKNIELILASISQQEARRIENRMLIATKIDEAMKAKGWKKRDLMLAMEKSNQSEITRWLSGTHNFTVDTLTDLGLALNINLLNTEESHKKIVQTYHISVTVESSRKIERYQIATLNSQLYSKKKTVLSC